MPERLDEIEQLLLKTWEENQLTQEEHVAILEEQFDHSHHKNGDGVFSVDEMRYIFFLQYLGNLLAGTQDLSKWRDTVLMENFFIQELLGKGRKKGVSLDAHNKEVIANNRSYRTRGVRTERYKYFTYFEHDPVIEELYDLKEDPHEQDNLISKPEYAAVLEKLREKTRDLHARPTD